MRCFSIYPAPAPFTMPLRQNLAPPKVPTTMLGRPAIAAMALLAPLISGCPRSDDGAGNTPPFAARLDSLVTDAFARREMPGGAVVIVQGAHVTYAKGFGLADLAARRPFTDTTPIVIGSTSKPLTALGVLRLVQQGRVALDTPIVRYVPEIRFKDPRAGAITLRHLLTNRSGMVVGFSGPAYRQPPVQDSLALEREAQAMAELPLLFAPGEGYAYSNRGWALAGYVVQRVSGVPIETFMQQEVFEPLGMTQTTLAFWTVPNLATGYAEGRATRNHLQPPSLTRGYGPSGMVVSTARDMGRFLVAMLNGGRTVSGSQFLTPALIQEAVRAQAEAESELGGPTRYALGWEVDSAFGAHTIKKAGSVSSMVSLWVMLPERQLAMAFAFNREDYGIIPLVPNVLAVVSGGEPAAPISSEPPPPYAPPAPAAVARGVVDRWLGGYDTRYGDMAVYRRGDSLFTDHDGAESAMVPTSDSAFVLVTDILKSRGKLLVFRRQRGGVTVWAGADSLGIRR